MADAKQGKPADECYNGSTQSRIVLAKPRLGGFGTSNFASTSSKGANPFGSVLRPPQLKPGSNPFLKVETEESNDEKEKDKPTDEKVDERLKENKDETEIPKFVPLRSTHTATRNSNSVSVQPTTSASTSGFVFGQNLSDRVVIQESIKNGEAAVDHCSTNGTTELLFTSAAASVRDTNQEEAGPSEPSSSAGDGLAAAAAEYERSHARPPPPTTNYTMTGEENETNVLQISCRLFAWEAGSWRERGRGVLRLNDHAGGARVVARVAGSLRVVLNTQLWPGMVAERAGAKSLRITAADAQMQIKLFLIMGAPADMAQLHRALLYRISVSKTQKSVEKADTTSYDDYTQDGEGDIDEEKHDVDNLSETNEDNDMPEGTRLEKNPDEKTDDNVTTDDIPEEAKAVKRKEPIVDETSPKRQCPDTDINK